MSCDACRELAEQVGAHGCGSGGWRGDAEVGESCRDRGESVAFGMGDVLILRR